VSSKSPSRIDSTTNTTAQVRNNHQLRASLSMCTDYSLPEPAMRFSGLVVRPPTHEMILGLML